MRIKKAQQEMVGFVLIVVLVVIALMVFLIISVRKPIELEDSVRIRNMISSVMDFTTECVVSSDNEDVGELILNCHNGRGCDSGEESCDLLEGVLDDLVEVVYESESSVAGLNFEIYHVDSSDFREDIYKKIQGNCSVYSEGGSELISTSDGRIFIEMSIC